jgi:pimeloyl-ACP methyl ester carboxylesterase
MDYGVGPAGGLRASGCFLFLIVAVVLLSAPARAGAADGDYAPLDQPGPPLSVPTDKLQASLKCSPGLAGASRTPVLLNPATGVTPDQNYSWNWEPALDSLGIPWCAYTAPYNTLGDIQESAEYLVFNIRKMYALAGRRIAIIGHSQGGMSTRWPLRFWPDTRAMVDDVIGFAPSNHGTTQRPNCSNGCPPGVWQQFDTAKFIAALNSRTETFSGISYTNVYTHFDEVVQPSDNNQHASSALHTGGGAITNVAIQDICPLDTREHNMIGTADPVAYALGVDALTHAGPADPARIDPAVCAQPSMPGTNPADINTWLQIAQAGPGLLAVATPINLVGAPQVNEEPQLRCYVFASCPANRSRPALRVSVKPRHPRPGTHRFQIRVRTRQGKKLEPVARARVRFGGKRIRRLTNRRGILKIRMRVKPGHQYKVLATRDGCNPGIAKVRSRRGGKRRS